MKPVHKPCWKGICFGDITSTAPIIQGGMGVGISLSGLASAVANCGGIGVISAAAIGLVRTGLAKGYAENNVAALREEIRKARSLTNGVLGVNLMVALSDFTQLAKAAIEEGIDIIFAGAGLPLNLPEYLGKSGKTKLVPIISSARAASTIVKWWKEKFDIVPDGFVVEGPKAGGHLGFKREQIFSEEYKLENIVTRVLDQVTKTEAETGKKIPVIAAGGIYTGSDIKRFMELGASGVQMGTRFVATEECDASPAFKQAYVLCRKEDIEIIESPLGLPGRAIINDFIKQARRGEKKPFSCPFHCITTCQQKMSPYCISRALANASKGNLEQGFVFVGSNGYRVESITTVPELFKELKREFHAAP